MPRAKKAAEVVAPDDTTDVIDDGGEVEQVEEEQEVLPEEVQDGEGDGGEDPMEDEDPSDVEFEIDITNPDGSVDTETVRVGDLPQIFAGVKKLQARERDLVEREQYLNSSKQLLDFVRDDEFVRTITHYRLEGRSPAEIAEAVYNFYLENQEYQSQDQAPVDPQIKAMQEKIQQYDKHFETQALESTRRDNNITLSNEFVGLGFDAELLDDPNVLGVANQVASEIFKELAPDIDPTQFTLRRKVTPTIAKMIWNEVSSRMQGKLSTKTSQPATQEKKSLAVRVKPLQRQAAAQKQGQQKASPKLPKMAGAGKGVDPTGGRQSSPSPAANNKRATAADRRSALQSLFHGE